MQHLLPLCQHRFRAVTKNLGNNKDRSSKAVRGFLKLVAIPTGKQNSFAAQNPPSFLLAVVRRDGNSWSLANAFENPFRLLGVEFAGSFHCCLR